ncbi:alpha-mannosidase [candidate division KSB1 bacterium]|nr:alpha-mannosidase [candidate division KSB1 bacterium]
MINRILIFLLLPGFIFAAAPQTDPIEIFNLLAYGGIGQMKYKVGGEPGGEAVDVDDSDWKIAYPGFKWDMSRTNIWFRTTLDIPEKIGGFSLVGRDMRMYLYIDNGGDVFVNGDSLGTFRWGTAEYVISQKIKAGDRFVIAIRGINGPGYGKIYDARIEFSGIVDFQRKLQRKVWGLMIAKRLAIELSDNPDYWLKEIENAAQNILHSDAFKKGDEAELLVEFDRRGESLRDLKNEMRSKFELHCAGYAHIDLAWMWAWHETVEVVRKTTESVLNLMDEYPDFKYSMGQAHAYEWMEDYMPELFEKVKQRVREGRWEVMGGMWVEPDCNLPSGESFVRQVLYGKRFFREKLGVDVKVCWIPDSFGFNWNLPQILARSGFAAFVTHKINWNDTNKFPYRFFWWVAPDGSRLMTYIPRSGYGHDLNGDHLVDFMLDERSELNLGKELVLYGRGDHGGGPQKDMLEWSETAKNAPAYPLLNLTTSECFFNSISDEEKSRLPEWDSELYLEFHRGTYTSQAKTKKHNRKGEGLICTTEKLATLAGQFGYDYPRKELFHSWRTLLFNQFHDILPGSSINEVYHDTELEYAESEQLSQDVLTDALTHIAQNIDTRGRGEAVIIFNPLSWIRTGSVTLSMNRIDAKKDWTILDETGKELPVQWINRAITGAELLFMAQEVPSLGYKVYRLIEKSPAENAEHLSAGENKLKNGFLEVAVDPASGLITGIYDKKNQRQVLAESRGNLLQLLPNDQTDAWNLRFTKPPIDLDKALDVKVVETGPVRATIKVTHTYLGTQKHNSDPVEEYPSSIFTQYISLYDGLPYLEVRHHVTWWEEHKVLKVAFPVNVKAATARFEIPYGSIERSTGFETSFEKARFEVSAQRWADLSDGDYGVSLINDCKYGYDIKGNVMRLSLLRSPTEPDPMCDRGYQDYKYALYPHAGDFMDGQVVRRGIEFNEPFVAQRVPARKGKLPKVFSFIQIEPENVVINALKNAEGNSDWILRIYEIAGKTGDVTVKFNRNLLAADEVNLLEETVGSVEQGKQSFDFRIQPNEIRTVKVNLKN